MTPAPQPKKVRQETDELAREELSASRRAEAPEDKPRPALPDPARSTGCTMTAAEELDTALAGLDRASRHRLAEHWAKCFGAPPPPRTSRR